ncbi:MAG: helix-turn-helix transcriptional regulator [Saprospiraceae bacterium]
MNTYNTISSREKEVLHLVAHEYSSKQIAAQLFISDHTVMSHRKNLMIKLDVKNTAGMVRKGFEKGLLQLSQSI